MTTLVDGKVKTLTIEEDLARSITKTQAWIDIVDDDSIYKFRVRAYRTVNGKKVYGTWSDEYTLRETLNPDEILAALRQYTIDYAKKNNPKFIYLDDREGSTPENSAYYVDGAFAGFSMYARQDDVIEAYKETIERYVDSVGRSGENCGFLFIRKSYPGDKEGVSGNSTEKTESTEESGTETAETEEQKAADKVAELIDAIYVQKRTDETDEQCKKAKEAWDALTDAQKELVEGENADPDYFGRDTGDASKDDPRNQDEIHCSDYY